MSLPGGQRQHAAITTDSQQRLLFLAAVEDAMNWHERQLQGCLGCEWQLCEDGPCRRHQDHAGPWRRYLDLAVQLELAQPYEHREVDAAQATVLAEAIPKAVGYRRDRGQPADRALAAAYAILQAAADS